VSDFITAIALSVASFWLGYSHRRREEERRVSRALRPSICIPGAEDDDLWQT